MRRQTDPEPQLVIEYPSAGATYHHDRYGIYSYGVYPSSVLAGQEKRSFKADFATLEEAQAAYPTAAWDGGGSGSRRGDPPDRPGLVRPGLCGRGLVRGRRLLIRLAGLPWL
jgi:hypothetical protein